MTDITKVLILGPLPPPIGGATILFRELSSYLNTAKDIECETINTTFRGKGMLSRITFSLVLILKIISKINNHDTVFFHASLRGAYQFGLFVKLICRAFNKPWGFRGFGGNYYNWYTDTNRLNKWLLRQGILAADMVLFETKQLITEFKKVTDANYVWYPNSRYIQPHSRANKRCQRLVFIGHVKPTKGINELISIADHLPKDIVIDVYGPIMDGLTEADFTSKNVSYRGVLEPNQVPNTLSKYDALVFPTYYEGEGYPGVILEAYACGLPVITTRWKMIPEIVDKTSGILIEPKNSDHLLEAINKITDIPFYKELQKGVFEKRNLYNMATWNKVFIDICRQLGAKTL